MGFHMDGITQEKLKEQLFYDPETGLFTRIRGIPGTSAGTVAGSIAGDGYLTISLFGKRYSAGRLAWLYVHGYMPSKFIDHIDGVRDNNRIANLREATPSENSQNQGIPRHNTSGVVGVCWNKQVRKWSASISVNSRSRHIGYFDSRDDAARARAQAKTKLHAFNPSVRER